MKKTVLIVSLILVAGLTLVSAQDDIETTEEVSTGLFTPDSAFYGLETAWDNAAMSLGVSSAEKVGQKRAAEAQVMAEEGNYEAVERAVRGLENAAARSSEESESIQNAVTKIEQVMQDAPEEAQEGLQTALDNVEERGHESLEVGTPEGIEPGEQDEQPDDVPEDTGEEPAEGTTNGEQQDDDEVTGEQVPDRTVEITGFGDNSYDTGEVIVEQGETVEFVYNHEGGTHDLVLEDSEGNELESTQVLSQSGETDSFTYTFEDEDDYEFYCSVGTHRATGMEGSVEIE